MHAGDRVAPEDHGEPRHLRAPPAAGRPHPRRGARPQGRPASSSTLPTAYGEKVVMRILDNRSISVGLEDLGFGENELTIWKNADRSAARHHPGHRAHRQRQDHHALFVAPQHGRQQAEHQHGRRPDRISPRQRQPDAGARQDRHDASRAALRALLRQDPDVVMLGEIRDQETARIAVQASLTGHLVLQHAAHQRRAAARSRD